MAEKKKYSYIKYPYSPAGWYCFGLGMVTVVMTLLVIMVAVRTEGKAGPMTAAVGVSALLLSLMGILFLVLSLREKEKNHLFAWIGGILSLLVIAVWTVIIVK